MLYMLCFMKHSTVHKTVNIKYVPLLTTCLKINRKQTSGVCLGGKLSPFSVISQNLIIEKRTLHKIHYQRNGFFKKFIVRETDSLENSMYRRENFHHFLEILLFFKRTFQVVFLIHEIVGVGGCNFEQSF